MTGTAAPAASAPSAAPISQAPSQAIQEETTPLPSPHAGQPPPHQLSEFAQAQIDRFYGNTFVGFLLGFTVGGVIGVRESSDRYFAEQGPKAVVPKTAAESAAMHSKSNRLLIPSFLSKGGALGLRAALIVGGYTAVESLINVARGTESILNGTATGFVYSGALGLYGRISGRALAQLLLIGTTLGTISGAANELLRSVEPEKTPEQLKKEKLDNEVQRRLAILRSSD